MIELWKLVWKDGFIVSHPVLEKHTEAGSKNNLKNSNKKEPKYVDKDGLELWIGRLHPSLKGEKKPIIQKPSQKVEKIKPVENKVETVVEEAKEDVTLEPLSQEDPELLEVGPTQSEIDEMVEVFSKAELKEMAKEKGLDSRGSESTLAKRILENKNK